MNASVGAQQRTPCVGTVLTLFTHDFPEALIPPTASFIRSLKSVRARLTAPRTTAPSRFTSGDPPLRHRPPRQMSPRVPLPTPLGYPARSRAAFSHRPLSAPAQSVTTQGERSWQPSPRWSTQRPAPTRANLGTPSRSTAPPWPPPPG